MHIKRVFKPIMLILSFFAFASAIVIATALFSDDPISKRCRRSVGNNINGYLEEVFVRGHQNKLHCLDKCVLGSGLIIGMALSKFAYPEADEILWHYIFGNGSDLKLRPDYFKECSYLRKKIAAIPIGISGPIVMRQSDDYRLSLALNSFFIDKKPDHIRIYHPRIVFPTMTGDRIKSIIPIGKMEIRVYDNFISIFGGKPFYVYSEWDL